MQFCKNVLLASLLFSSCHAATIVIPKPVEITVASGYAQGPLRGQSQIYQAIPLYMRISYDFTKGVNLSEKGVHFQMGIEIFADPVLQPYGSIETGFNANLRMTTPFINSFRPYFEAAAGPMYFGVTTVAQGRKGFEFLDQVGAGLQFLTVNGQSITFGYRYRHISHAGLRQNNPNRGIDANAAIVEYNWRY